jgi:hypothetical protein
MDTSDWTCPSVCCRAEKPRHAGCAGGGTPSRWLQHLRIHGGVDGLGNLLRLRLTAGQCQARPHAPAVVEGWTGARVILRIEGRLGTPAWRWWSRVGPKPGSPRTPRQAAVGSAADRARTLFRDRTRSVPRVTQQLLMQPGGAASRPPRTCRPTISS